MNKLVVTLIICVGAALAVGCASVSPRLYALSPLAKSGGETSRISATVGPVSVPAVADRPQLVFHTGSGQLQVDEFNRWAAPLKGEIARVVAENLSSLLGSPYVSVFPQTLSLNPAYRVTIDVTRFEAVPGVAVRLTAVWCVRATADERRQEGAANLFEQLPDNVPLAATIDAYNRLLTALSGDIANALRKLAGGAGRELPSS